jgi:hypothetical protein
MPTAKRSARKTVAKPVAKKPVAKKPVAKKAATKVVPKSGSGASVEAYFAQQPADKRALLEKLRAQVNKGVPDASVSIKWGVPFYQRSGKDVCALAAFKDFVAINIFASPSALADPGKKLEGGGKSSRMLKVRSADDIDAASIQRWLKVAAG